MKILALYSVLFGIFFLGVGLWKHDWRVILAALILMVIAPLIVEDAKAHTRNAHADRRRREYLDRLWDDDLSDSA